MYCNGERGVKEFFFWKRDEQIYVCFRFQDFGFPQNPVAYTNCVCLTQYGYYYYYQERTIYGYILSQIGILTNSALREWESFVISIL